MSGTTGSDGLSQGVPSGDGTDDVVILTRAATALRAYLHKNPELREAVREFARFVLAEPAVRENPTAATPSPVVSEHKSEVAKAVERMAMTLKIGGIERDVAVATPGAALPAVAGSVGPRIVLRESTDVPGLAPPVREGNWDQAARVDGRRLAARCRLKAEGCRRTVEQRRLQQAGATYQDERIRSARESLVARAKAMNPCYLWMIDPRGPALPDDGTLSSLADCYEAVAQTVELVTEVIESDEGRDGGPAALEPALSLAAEAQCMLRCALTPVGFDDHDQTQAHVLLRQLADERRVLIRRFMRITETAAIERVGELKRETAEAAARRRGTAEQSRRRRALFSKARYHAERLCRGAGQGVEPESHDQERLWEAVEGLLAEGVPPTDRELRDVLIPVVDARDEEELIGRDRPSLAVVWRELERYFAEKEERRCVAGSLPANDELSPVVRQVRRLLEGKRVLMIGGIRRPNHQRALEQAFGLDELMWPDTRAHQSLDDFESDVRHERTALVLLAIRWSSHSFGDVERLCDRWGKPFVRLPAGYNPEQVAVQILQQASGKLAAAGAAAAAAADAPVGAPAGGGK
jgi:hypothetical protein